MTTCARPQFFSHWLDRLRVTTHHLYYNTAAAEHQLPQNRNIHCSPLTAVKCRLPTVGRGMWGCVENIFKFFRIYYGWYLWNFLKLQLPWGWNYWKLKNQAPWRHGWHLPYAKKKRTSRLSVFVAVRLRGKFNFFFLWFGVCLVFVVFCDTRTTRASHISSYCVACGWVYGADSALDFW